MAVYAPLTYKFNTISCFSRVTFLSLMLLTYMKTDHRTRKLIKKIQQRIREEKMLKEIEKWVEDDVKKRRGR